MTDSLKQDQLEQFRIMLHEQKAELQSLEQTLAEAGKTVELDQARVGRLSRMDALAGQQMALETQRRRRRQLVNIESALRRIDAGEFGFCRDCDEEIKLGRLQADPSNALCIDCAGKLG